LTHNLKLIKEKKASNIQNNPDKKSSYREPEQIELYLPLRERQQVEIWRGKKIDDMTREEAIKALKECATAYRDHLNDDKEVWERWQRWGYPPRQRPSKLNR